MLNPRTKNALYVLIFTAIAVLGAYFLITEINKMSQDSNESILSDFWQKKKPNPTEIAETKDWKTYRNEEYGFEFMYPRNFTKTKDISSANNQIAFESYNGHLVVNVINSKFDPKNIEGLYGKIPTDEIKTLEVGGKIWYQFGFGDAGCGGPMLQTDFKDKILQTAFISCDEDPVPYLSENDNLIKQILSTFKFIK